MSELKACPFCGEQLDPQENQAVWDSEQFYEHPKVNGCQLTGLMFPEQFWNTRPIEDKLQAELASRDEIIARLKEDGERLAASLNSTYKDGEFCCDGCGKWIKGDFVEWLTGTYDTGLLDAQHAPDCPIALHRALMKEVDSGRTS